MGRKYGQHFLHHPAVLDDIVAAAAPVSGEAVLEIGPGEGALTGRLLGKGVQLTAVEVDEALAGALDERWGGTPGFRLIRGDIRKVDLSPGHLFAQEAPYAVVANLPYYLSTPLLFRLAACRHYFTRLVLMLQEEVAQRMAAGPADGKSYGSLSVAIQHAFAVRLVRRVPPAAFRPPPKVHSAVVALKPRPARLSETAECGYFAHVKTLFTRRRKRMLGGLREARERLEPGAWARLEAMIGERRAENLSPEEHLEIYLLLHPEGPHAC